MTILEHSISEWAAKTPSKVAIIDGSGSITYYELWSRICQKIFSVKNEGLHRNRAKVFLASQDAEFIITYCAIHLLDAVAVPLEQSTPAEVVESIESQLSDVVFDDEIADILYTTGTTGKSKGVMLSNQALAANTENLIDAQHYSQDLLFVITGPLNHIGSLSKILPTIAVGGTICILEGMKDISAIINAFSLPYEKIATFLVPSSIKIMMTFAKKELHALHHKIDFIETGAAPMPASDMEQFCKILPSSRLYNTYASTETGIIATYDYNANGCIAGCLGHAMKHANIEFSEDGHIICSGKMIMSGYVLDDELTASVLKEGKIHTSDIGYIDDNGNLRLEGRKGDIINIGGFKVSPTEVEDIAQKIGYIQECICVPASHPVLGTVLKLIVVPTDPQLFNKKEIATFLSQHLESYKVPTKYELAQSIAKTYNGKIDRKYYNKG